MTEAAVDPTALLGAARSGLVTMTEQVATVLRLLPGSAGNVAGTRWSMRETAAHLVTLTDIYVDLASGVKPSINDFAPETVARRNDQRIADISESDPSKLAGLVTDATDRFLDVTAGRPGEDEVPYVGGMSLDLATLACILLGEPVLHGYDMAATVGYPWPIDPGTALLVLAGYGPVLGLVLNPETSRGHTAGYEVELRGGPSFTVRLDDGRYQLEAAGSAPVDCTISADPVALLLLAAGRLALPPAIALGLVSAGGDRPELALGFNSLFLYP